jgi:dihydroorotate dehydrogenase
MGFPNEGVEKLKLPHVRARIGINIGKGKDTPLENAAEDYIALLHQVHTHADYIAVNVSSPNTHNLRALQTRDMIEPLLRKIADARDAVSPRVPVLVKIAPDLSFDEIDGIVTAARYVNLDGIIATNTTVSRDGAPEYTKQWSGGLSGAPLRARSTEIIRHITDYTRGEFPITGVGGVSDVESALEKFQAGALLVQLFTGLVYEGPALVKRINQALLREPLRKQKLIFTVT